MWRTVKLGDVCELAYGKALDSEDRLDIGGYPAFGANGVKTKSKKYLHNKPSIVIGRKGSAGELNKVNEPFWALDVTYYTKTDDKVLNLDYLYYVLSTLNLPSLARGIKPGINRNDVYEQTIKLPPLSEQQRIVTKLDAAFAEIDKAVELVEAKEANAERLKGSLLDALLKDDDAMWKTVKLGDVCDFQGGSQPPKKEFVFEPQEGYIRFLQIRDFKSDKNVTFIPISKKNRLCNTDDILIGRYGASVGQILRGLEGAYNVALMKTIPNVEMISKGWLYSYLNSPLFQKPLMEVSSRSAQNGFSKDDISGFELPLPPLAEQQRIVAKLDAAFAEIETLYSKTSIAKEKYGSLKSAILAQELQPPESNAA